MEFQIGVWDKPTNQPHNFVWVWWEWSAQLKFENFNKRKAGAQ
jgi:hypothetical protein